MAKKKRHLEDYDYREYIKDLNPEEREWVVKFYTEYYRASLYGKETIIKDEEMKKEAIRNSNSRQRDLLSYAERHLDELEMVSLEEIEYEKSDFMEEASDHWEWNDVYKAFGYEKAFECIMEQAQRDLNNQHVDKKITLLRFRSKMNELDRVHKRRREQGD